MFHLTPCPQARAWKHRARALNEPGDDENPSGVLGDRPDDSNAAQEFSGGHA